MKRKTIKQNLRCNIYSFILIDIFIFILIKIREIRLRCRIAMMTSWKQLVDFFMDGFLKKKKLIWKSANYKLILYVLKQITN